MVSCCPLRIHHLFQRCKAWECNAAQENLGSRHRRPDRYRNRNKNPHIPGSCRRAERATAARATCSGNLSRQRWLHGKGSEPLCQTAGSTITPSTGKEIPSAHFGLRALKVTGAFVKVDPDPRPCLVIGGLRPVVTSYPFDDLEGKGQEIWVQRWVPIEATKESLSWSADRWAESCSSSLESASSSSCVCCSHKRESGSDYARCYGWAEFKLTQFQ